MEARTKRTILLVLLEERGARGGQVAGAPRASRRLWPGQWRVTTVIAFTVECEGTRGVRRLLCDGSMELLGAGVGMEHRVAMGLYEMGLVCIYRGICAGAIQLRSRLNTTYDHNTGLLLGQARVPHVTCLCVMLA